MNSADEGVTVEWLRGTVIEGLVEQVAHLILERDTAVARNAELSGLLADAVDAPRMSVVHCGLASG